MADRREKCGRMEGGGEERREQWNYKEKEKEKNKLFTKTPMDTALFP